MSTTGSCAVINVGDTTGVFLIIEPK